MKGFMLRYHIPAVTVLMASVVVTEIIEDNINSLFYIIPIGLIILAIHAEIVGLCVEHRKFRLLSKELVYFIGYTLDYLEYLTLVPCYYLVLKNSWIMPSSLLVLILPLGTFIMNMLIKRKYGYLIYGYDYYKESENLNIKELKDGY